MAQKMMKLEDVAKLVKVGGDCDYVIPDNIPDYAVYLLWREYAISVACEMQRYRLYMSEYDPWASALLEEQKRVPDMDLAETMFWSSNFININDSIQELQSEIDMKINHRTDRMLEKLSKFNGDSENNNLATLLGSDLAKLIDLYKRGEEEGWSIQAVLDSEKERKEDS